MTVALYNVSIANTQANMTAGGGKLANMTGGPIRSAFSNATK